MDSIIIRVTLNFKLPKLNEKSITKAGKVILVSKIRTVRMSDKFLAV